MNILKYLLSVIRWSNAVNHAADGEFHRALTVLEKLYDQGEISIQYKLLQAVCHFELVNPDSSLECLVIVLTKIDHFMQKEGTDKPQLIYLKAFAVDLKSSIEGRKYSIDWHQVSLSLVYDHTKDIFPLYNHPNWK